jgi:hypothetical protein
VRTLSAPVSAGSWTINASPVLAQGVYTVQATQSDTSAPANTTTTAAHTFTLDTTAPTATAAVIAAEDATTRCRRTSCPGLNTRSAFRVYANVTDTGGSDPTLGTTTAALTAIIAGTQNVTLTYHAAPVTVGGTPTTGTAPSRPPVPGAASTARRTGL